MAGIEKASNGQAVGVKNAEGTEETRVVDDIVIDKRAERRLRTKIDLMVVPTVALLYLFCFIDRTNIGNARLAGLEADLGMVGNDYNALLSMFYVSYTIFEIPCTILCKVIGPGWFLPASSLGFGVMSICTGFVQTKAQAFGVRFLLGVFEASMLPGVAYYLSRWYVRSELTFRLSLYIVTAPLAGAFGGLLASGILSLDHFGGLHGWRMIFVIEGIITVGLSVMSFFTLTDRPETARWLNADEKLLAIQRINAERVTTKEVLDHINTTKLRRGILNPVTLSTAFIFLLDNVTVQGIAVFAPTIVRTIYPTSSSITQQLYTVPPYIVGAFFTVLLPLLSWLMNTRQIFMVLSAPLMIIGYILFLASTDPKVRYGATFLIMGGAFPFGAITNAQVSANIVSDTSRTSAIGLNVVFGSIGGLISTWSFLSWDGPNYPIGNGLNLATSSTMLVTSLLVLVWMKRDNKSRAGRDPREKLHGLSEQQIEDLDWKHPDFRWHI